MPSAPSLPSLLVLSLRAGGGGRTGRLFRLSVLELISTWNSAPAPSELTLNVKGVPVCIGVVGVPKTGDPDTAVEKYIDLSFIITSR